MKEFEIEYWGRIISVEPEEKGGYLLYHDGELIASLLKRPGPARSAWSSPNLDQSDASLIGSIITARLFEISNQASPSD
ncbi:MAG: hypothetical protein EOO88_00260 [Pedobacter sp.]|nr:MAG: hypothetical protein EOO88_00260 [Pedobacter sp.]